MKQEGRPRWLWGVLILAVVGLLVGGAGFYRSQEEAVRRGVEGNLYAVARLKAEEIARWRHERQADAAVLMANAPFMEASERWMAAPNPQDEADLLRLFRVLRDSYHYTDILLADMNGQARLSLSGYVGPLDSEVTLPLAEAARDKRPTFTDLHWGAGGRAIHMGVIAPLYVRGNGAQPFGAVILQIAADEYLYPLLETWPAPSRTAESLLVRRDGDAALFLNNPRYAPNAALAMRIPFSEADTPSVMAVKGRAGVVAGEDYRGEAVIAALHPVPDSPWFVVAKMDKGEAIAEWRSRSALILGLIGGLMAAVVAAVVSAWQTSRRAHYHALLQAEIERRQTEERYHTTLLSIGDGVIATDAEGTIQFLNPVAESLTGWENDRARGLPLEQVFRIINEETRQPVETPVARVVREGAVVGLANHTVLISRDGRERPIADSGAPIHDESGQVAGVVLVFRDQTAERAAHEALANQSRNLSAIIAASPIGMMVLDQQGEVIHANPAAEGLFRTHLAELDPRRCGDVLACINRHGDPRGCGYSPRCALCPINAAIGAVLAGGAGSSQQEYEFELDGGGERRKLWLRYGVEGVALDGAPHAIVAIEDITARKEAEEALRQREETYRALVNGLPDVIARYDRNYRHVFVSENVIETSGRSAAETLGKTHTELGYPPEMVALWERTFEQVFRTGQPAEVEYTVATPLGTSIRNRRVLPEFDAEGRVATVLSISRDITRARQLEADYQTLFNTMLDGFAVHEIILDEAGRPVDYRFLSVNPAFERMTGLKASEIVGKTVLEALPDTEPYWIETYGRVALTGEPVTFENYAQGLDKYFEVTAFRPAPGRFACIFADVTERRRAEQALHESEEQYRQLFEAESDAILLVDNDTGRILRANRAACALYGYSEEEMLSLRNTDLSAEPEKTTELMASAPTASDDVVVIPLRQHRKRDGTVFPVEATGRFFMRGGRRVHITAIRDITARRQAEAEAARLQEQLAQAVKMESVGRLAGGVAHDFNNMLQAILGHAELALEDLPPSDPLHDSLTEIQRAARRSADLTRQLLAFARKQTISPQVLDLNETLAGMLKMLQRLIGEDIDLVWSPGYELWPVRMDPSQLDQILANLCVNARDAINGVGRITIETTNATLDAAYCATHPEATPGDYVMLAVSDTGCGMSKEVMSHLFEPFFTTKPVGEGTGLGLATVYGIVKQNEGSISAYSEPGQGTTFKIYLPRHAAPKIEAHNEGAAGALRGGDETVLLVEDEAAILTMGRRMLERLGYTVLTADSPTAAMDAVREHNGAIHLLITDVVMPSMNGRELANALRAAQPGLKCLFMSGYTANVIAHRGVLEEGVFFMPKPFTLPILAARVREALESK